MKVIRVESGENRYYKIPLDNKKFLIISNYLPKKYIEDLFSKRTIIFNYEENNKEVSVKFKGCFGEEEKDSIDALLKVINHFNFGHISDEEINLFLQNCDDKFFEDFYKRVNIKYGTDIYCGIEEEEKLIKEAKEKVEEALSWYKDNKETLDVNEGKIYFHHLKRIFDKKFIKSYCENE